MDVVYSRDSFVRGIRVALGVAAFLVAAGMTGCGGGGEGAAPLPAPQHAGAGSLPLNAALHAPSKQARAPDQLPTATQVLDWAEWALPGLFPGHAEDRVQLPYLYRYYPQTGNYVGIAGDSVYAMGPVTGGPLKRVGSVWDYACSVAPESCGVALDGFSVRLDAGAKFDVVQNGLTANGSAVVTGSIDGDALSAVGPQPTIYLIGEDPAGVLVPSSLSFSSPQRFMLGVHTAPGISAGLRSGVMRIQACLDPACETRIAGTPVRVPYTVFVAGPTALSRASIEATSPAGEVSNQSIDVTLPPGATGFSASVIRSSANDFLTPFDVTTKLSADGRTGTLDVVLKHLLAGSFTGTISLTTYFPPVNGVPVMPQSQEIKVSYVATGADAAACAFPSNYEIRISISSLTASGSYDYVIPYTCANGVVPDYGAQNTITVTSAAAGSEAYFLPGMFGFYDILVCDRSRYFEHPCLPAGEYKFNRTFAFLAWDSRINNYGHPTFTVPVTVVLTP
ncbi:hypothetical protein [Caenimonas aquaedulcis]|uniref:Uncharacterized protein n=1 Tax=Caenimonas aquaedulcis TaxID=2793270 RepID=A0A931MJ49_9BURK|nr:hypothetical protein [Caenimonas aquaedulcis]MBG9390529.1 hypothetical protein [Caenimonas aquaedulcis]